MRSDSEHCGSRVAVEQEDEEEKEEEKEEKEEEEATDIKSNNPHLAGGELYIIYILYICVCVAHISCTGINLVLCWPTL